MIRFNNDYNHGAHPEILEALGAINGNSYGGYGEDEWCEKAAELIREKIRCADAAVHFFPGATQANFIVTAAALSPVQSVIAADTGHINCHEAASIENTGHKILELLNTDGKISAKQIAACAAAYYEGGEPEYLTEPKMVYLFSNGTGTLYSLQELKDIHEVCRSMICICSWTGHGLATVWDRKRMMFLLRISPLSQMFSISAERNAGRCLARLL